MQTSNPFTNYNTKKSANFSWIHHIFHLFKNVYFLPESREKGGNENYEGKELVHFSQISDHFFTDFPINIGGLSSLCFLKLVSIRRLERTLFHGFLPFSRFKRTYWRIISTVHPKTVSQFDVFYFADFSWSTGGLSCT